MTASKESSPADQNGPLLGGNTVVTPLGAYPAQAATYYANGGIRSLTLNPGERALVPTPAGPVLTRLGFTFHEDGSLDSVEPEQPVEVDTPIGVVTTYDDAAKAPAERYSLCFTREGRVSGLTVSGFSLLAQGDDGSVTWVRPRQVLSPDEDGEFIELPVRLDFREGFAVVRSGDQTALLPLEGTLFRWLDADDEGGCAGGCAGCSGCGGKGR